MQKLAETCERIGATTKKLEKTAILADYLRSRELDEAAISAVFLSGRAFPAFEERTLQVGGSLLWKVVKEVSGASDAELSAAYRQRGDLGAAVYDVLSQRAEIVPLRLLYISQRSAPPLTRSLPRGRPMPKAICCERCWSTPRRSRLSTS